MDYASFQRNMRNKEIFHFDKVIYSKEVLLYDSNDVYEGQTI